MAQLTGPQNHRIDVALQLKALLQKATPTHRRPALGDVITGSGVIHGGHRDGQTLETLTLLPIGQNT
jgi:hypothetical protein